MFAFKKKYFLIIESIKDINLRNIKKYNKYSIIYRNKQYKENFTELLKFRKECRLKIIYFYVANYIKLSIQLNSDGIYLSSYNKTFSVLNIKRFNFKIIGSAHNYKEIFLKMKKGCSCIFLSKLFLVDYNPKAPFLDIIKFNSYTANIQNKLAPLGGIKISNLNKLKIVDCDSFAVLSGVKKKPAIIDLLF